MSRHLRRYGAAVAFVDAPRQAVQF